jgi:hypothetical protein
VTAPGTPAPGQAVQASHVAVESPSKPRPDDPLLISVADALRRIEVNYDREGSGPGSRFEGELLEDLQARQAVAMVRSHERPDAGTTRHIPTGATWITWADGKQPPWNLVAEAVARLTGGGVKIRVGRDEDELGRLHVAVYRDLPEMEDE